MEGGCTCGHVRYRLKTPYRDGITHIVLEPLDMMARLAALVPPPRLHLTRFHGVFAPRRPKGSARRMARHANSLGTGRWFESPIRVSPSVSK